MQNQTYRLPTLERYFGSLVALSFIVYFLLMNAQMWHRFAIHDRLAIGEIPIGESVLFILLGGLSFIVILHWSGHAMFGQTYQISLSETSIHVQARRFWGLKLLSRLNNAYYVGEIPYVSIRRIEATTGLRSGHAEITLLDGKKVVLGFRILERNSEFMQQLATHVSPEQFGVGTDILGKPRRFRVLVGFIYAFVLIPLFTTFLGHPIIDSLKSTIWNEELSAWAVRGVSPDPDGSLWVSMGQYEGDIYVGHIANSTREYWILPKEVCMDCPLHSVSHTAKGYPVVLSSRSGSASIYTWDGDQWKKTSANISFFNRHINSSGTKVWGDQEGKLVFQDFATGEVQEVLFPPDVFANDTRLSSYKVFPDNTVLVYFFERDKPEVIYRLSEGQWVEAASSSPVSDTGMAYGLDAQERIWAVKSLDSEKRQITLGYYNTNSQAWVWQDVGQFFNHPLAYFKDLAVDSLGRIWIAGVYELPDERGYFLDFVKVISWLDNEVLEIEEYNQNNSNLKSISSLSITSNGRIWASNPNLFWMDATSPQLPPTLPDWAIKLDIYEAPRSLLPIFFILMALLFCAWLLEQK